MIVNGHIFEMTLESHTVDTLKVLNNITAISSINNYTNVPNIMLVAFYA